MHFGHGNIVVKKNMVPGEDLDIFEKVGFCPNALKMFLIKKKNN